jgi:hypothetical protein
VQEKRRLKNKEIKLKKDVNMAKTFKSDLGDDFLSDFSLEMDYLAN